jgi:hypothetical protein
MKYYIIEPEVAGGFGRNTVMDSKTHPPIVQRLHYELHGWLGDELLETFPCYIVTQRLRKSIEDTGMTGAEFAAAEITVSEQFKEIYPNRIIPDFEWLRVIGRAGTDDFGTAQDNRLVVSERVLSLAGLKHCDIAEFTDQ